MYISVRILNAIWFLSVANCLLTYRDWLPSTRQSSPATSLVIKVRDRVMPTTLSWTYVGGHQVDTDNGDVQRLKEGDVGIDDILGEVTIVSLSGGDLIVETGEKDADGSLVQKQRTCGHIRAKINGPAPAARLAPTGRPGQAKGGMYQFLGAAGASASPTLQAPKLKGKAAKGFGRPKRGAAAKAPAAAAPAAAACTGTICGFLLGLLSE